MRKRNKILTLIFTSAILLAVAFGYYLYNKPPADVEHSMGKQVHASDLYAAYLQDSATAKRNFTNQILEVTGSIAGISNNQDKQPIILLKTNTEGASINCTLEGAKGNIAEQTSITIKGICNGLGEGDADLGIPGDVYLVRCYVVK